MKILRNPDELLYDASKRGPSKTLADLANEKREVVEALLKRSQISPT